ncbi:class III extradiol ring-cleavage dioxygenase [Acetobacter malorum]|uniref:Aromatic ring-opening dioxygenase LigA n=1 Tax=Acetobacter malorum TaxID=178901 RepID=A0A1Y3GEI3_9PROT|nr:class III extradiol ring-cleavage dioxygenase [Acetobacter malorum]OUJ07556.1 aromatic ring-opening dioxygenase LigA [Acetobacter malorum]
MTSLPDQTPHTPLPRQPVLFLPHGGGPCFFMDWPDTWDNMAAFLRGVSHTLPQKPDAILVVSGHWETEIPTVTAAARPPLIYDYYGFPPHTYHLRYPAPGSPALAEQVQALLTKAGIPNAADPERGLDHGVFIPFMLAFEEADIPVVELSLQQTLDPGVHLRIGQTFTPLRDQNVLIVGTGLTYHNLRHFMGENPASNALSHEFDAWLVAAVRAPETQRNAALQQWEAAPGARICHPREEHLLPLMVAAGAAGPDRGIQIYRDTVMGKALSGFRFG